MTKIAKGFIDELAKFAEDDPKTDLAELRAAKHQRDEESKNRDARNQDPLGKKRDVKVDDEEYRERMKKQKAERADEEADASDHASGQEAEA